MSYSNGLLECIQWPEIFLEQLVKESKDGNNKTASDFPFRQFQAENQQA